MIDKIRLIHFHFDVQLSPTAALNCVVSGLLYTLEQPLNSLASVGGMNISENKMKACVKHKNKEVHIP